MFRSRDLISPPIPAIELTLLDRRLQRSGRKRHAVERKRTTTYAEDSFGIKHRRCVLIDQGHQAVAAQAQWNFGDLGAPQAQPHQLPWQRDRGYLPAEPPADRNHDVTE